MHHYKLIFVVIVILLQNYSIKVNAETWLDKGNYDISWFTNNESPYTIRTNKELAGMAYLINNGYIDRRITIKLGNDIDLSGKTWITVGSVTSKIFKGTFDGQGHKITGIKIEKEKQGQYLYGFWGYILETTIKNVTFEGRVEIQDSNSGWEQYSFCVGGVAGAARDVTFEKCKCNMDVICQKSILSKSSLKSCCVVIGGLCGYLYSGTMSYCSHQGNVGASSYLGDDSNPPTIGGLVGANSGTIEYCENISSMIDCRMPKGDHDNSTLSAGGLVGSGGKIRYSRSIVNSIYLVQESAASIFLHVGGICSHAQEITGCYSSVSNLKINSVYVYSGGAVFGGVSSMESTTKASFSNNDISKECSIQLMNAHDGVSTYSSYEMRTNSFLDEINIYPQVNLGKRIWTPDENGYPCIAETHEGSKPAVVNPTGITVSPSSKTIKEGETFTLSYTLTPSNAETTVTWSSDDSSTASVSSSGVVTGKKAGTTYINATTSNGKTDYCKVIVESATIKPTGISVSPSSKTVKVGDTFTLSYTLTPSNAETTVTWSSDDSSIASVSSSGKVTAKKAGSTYINATTDNGKTAWCSVKVEAIPTGIAIDATNFPDANFRAYLLKQNYGKDGILTATEISKVDKIDVSGSDWDNGRGIMSLEGIEHFTVLTELHCEYNYLVFLDVSKNAALKYLDCKHTVLRALDVSKNPALTYLDCNYNQLTALDVSKNPALTYLDCSVNYLTALDVSKNTAMTHLDCNYNQLTALDVSKNTALTYLDCCDIQLTALDVSKNPALTYLDCSNKAVFSKAVIQLKALDVSKNTALTYLDCSNIQLTTLDVSKNTALTKLYCGSNQLTALDVSKNMALTDLECDGNQLTALDVSKNMALTYLECGGNQLTALDVSENTALFILHCAGNQLTALNVSNTVLAELFCNNNQLRGKAMDDLINGLPYNKTIEVYNFFVVDAETQNDGNVCTTIQVEMAKAKGWTPYDSWWRDYPGSDPSGINDVKVDADTDAPIYNLQGQRLTKPRKGINIIGGKKVMVK